MEKVENKSIKLTQSTIKKIWTIADITGLKQGEVIDQAIKKYYPEAMRQGEVIELSKKYLLEKGHKKKEAIKILCSNYNLREQKGDTEEEKQNIYSIIDKYLDDFKKVSIK